MDQVEPEETNIVKWNDGTDSWTMIIKPGKVEFKTTAQVPDQALKAHSEAWTEAFNFIRNAFEKNGGTA